MRLQFHYKRKECLKHAGTFSRSQLAINRSSSVPLRGTFAPLPYVYSKIISWRGNWRVSKSVNSPGCQLACCLLSKAARSPLRNRGRRRVQRKWQSTGAAKAWRRPSNLERLPNGELGPRLTVIYHFAQLNSPTSVVYDTRVKTFETQTQQLVKMKHFYSSLRTRLLENERLFSEIQIIWKN